MLVLPSAGRKTTAVPHLTGRTYPHFFGPLGDIWNNRQVSILPTVDFNADDKVDLTDMVLLIDNWGTDDTLHDIGPFAWGDGKVDIEDLKVFITEWEKVIAADSEPTEP